MNKKYFSLLLILLFTILFQTSAYSQFSIDFNYNQGYNIDASQYPLLKMKFKAYDNDKPITINQSQITINKDNLYYKILNLTSPDANGWQTLSWNSRAYNLGFTYIYFQYKNRVYPVLGNYTAESAFTQIYSDKDKYFKDYQFGDIQIGDKSAEFLYVQAMVTKFKDGNMVDVRLDSLILSNTTDFSYYWYGSIINSNLPPTNLISPFKYLFDVTYKPQNTNYKRAKVTAYYDGGMESSVNLIAGWFPLDRSSVLQVTYPNGGEKFAPCDWVTIKWKGNSNLLPSIVEYTTDGKTWKQIITTRDSFFLWQVPNEITASARIRVRQDMQNTSTKVLKIDNVPVFRVDYSFDGQKLMTANTNGILQEWDLNTYTPLQNYFTNQDAGPYIKDSVRGLKYYDLEKFAVCYFVRNPIYRQDTIAFFEASSQFPKLSIGIDTSFKVREMYLSPDKKFLSLVPEIGNEIWNVSIADGSIDNIKSLPYPISAFNYCKETKQAVVAYKNNIVQVLSYPDFNVVSEFDFTEIPIIYQIALAPNGKMIAVSCFPPTTTAVTDTKTESHLFDIATKQIIRTQRMAASTPIGLEFNPSSSYCVMANENQPQIAFWDLPTNNIPGTLSGNVGELTDMAYAPDGGSIAASARNSNENVTIRNFTYPESDSSDNPFAIIKPNIVVDSVFFQPNYYYNPLQLSFDKKICNNGPVDLIIDKTTFKNNKHFKLINITFPDTLKVNNCRTLQFAYMPLDTGWVSDSLILYSCFGNYYIPIKGYVMKRNIDFVLNSFDFGESCLVDSVEKEIDLLKNNDKIPALINIIGISKGVDSPFRLLTNIKDTVLLPGQVLRVRIKFHPKTIGQNLDKISAFYSNQQVLYSSSNLSGVGIGTQVKLSHNDLRFIPEIPSRKLKITNMSNNPIVISKTNFVPTGFFNMLTALPISINPGDSTELEVLWNGNTFSTVKMQIEAKPCVSQSEIILGPYVGNSSITGPFISADPTDENVKMPITFENSNNYDYNGVRFFETEVSINSRMFLPVSVQSDFGTAKIISNEIINDKRVFKIRVDGDFARSGTAAVVTGVAGLAETDTTSIEFLNTSAFWGKAVKTAPVSGMLKITNLCGNRRIIQNGSVVYIRSISPMPASEFLNVELNSDKAEEYLVQLSDLIGTVIYTQKYQVTQGLNKLVIPLQGFSSGYYYLILKNSAGIDKKQILILK